MNSITQIPKQCENIIFWINFQSLVGKIKFSNEKYPFLNIIHVCFMFYSLLYLAQIIIDISGLNE